MDFAAEFFNGALRKSPNHKTYFSFALEGSQDFDFVWQFWYGWVEWVKLNGKVKVLYAKLKHVLSSIDLKD